MHISVFEAADRFQSRAKLGQSVPFLKPILSMFEEIRPESFFRELGTNPDAVLSWDMALFEERRPFRIESAASHWKKFDDAVSRRQHEQAISLFADAPLNPLALRGVRQLDAHELGAHALNLELKREERGRALVQLLFGMPVSREAKTLTAGWVEMAEGIPAVKLRKRVAWWRRGLR